MDKVDNSQPSSNSKEQHHLRLCVKIIKGSKTHICFLVTFVGDNDFNSNALS